MVDGAFEGSIDNTVPDVHLWYSHGTVKRSEAGAAPGVGDVEGRKEVYH